MRQIKKPKLLRKELKLLDVYAISTGATLSAGFFLLPGLAAREAGPAMVLAYLIAALPLIPAVFSKVELMTAMPRAGGIYYVLDRALGPLVGTIGGVGIWLVLVLKVAFALIGMGAYIRLFAPNLPITPIALLLALALGGLNLFGAKKTGRLQIWLVSGLLAIVIAFIGGGLGSIDLSHYQGFFDSGMKSILATSGLVYISYIGVTKVASLSEEVKDPERNLPLGIFLAMGTALLIYVLGTAVMVGVLPMSELAGDLTPAATAAERLFGRVGTAVVSFGALLAFISVANAGIMSASRYPLAMGRDHILPRFFFRMGKKRVPYYGVLVTVASVIVTLLLLNPLKIAKLASTFQLMVFAMTCVAVIAMRESQIDSYDPGFRSPFYPWMQLFGVFSSIVLIMEMGVMTQLFSLSLITIGVFWYFFYVRKRTKRTGAILDVFARWGKNRVDGLDTELRGILKEKGLRDKDPFDEIVARSQVLDLKEESDFEDLVRPVAKLLANMVPMTQDEIAAAFLEGTQVGATPVARGVALPHLSVDGIDFAELVLVRALPGVRITLPGHGGDAAPKVVTVKAVFFLVSPDSDPTQHLRILAQIAGHVEEESFPEDWASASNEQDLKEVMLRDERCLSLTVRKNGPLADWIGKKLKEIELPEESLVALVRRREGKVLIPKGNTEFQNGDRLTIIGEQSCLKEIARRYSRVTVKS